MLMKFEINRLRYGQKLRFNPDMLSFGLGYMVVCMKRLMVNSIRLI